MMKIKNLAAGLVRPSRDDIVRELARARGVGDEAALRVFLDSTPRVVNPMASLPNYQKASERLHRAFRDGERVTFFGDYDADGVTALAQMLDLARAAGTKTCRVFIPERAIDDYGLTLGAVDKCLEQHGSTLIFTVDCGSSSLDVLETCRNRGIDVIVLDHHAVPELPATGHPAFAHLNPKDPGCGGGPELAAMSAAGLAFLFSEAFALEHGLSAWSRSRSLVLGGLGTLVDVMPLTGLNRSLVKASLRLMNNGGGELVPGLAALRDAMSVNKVTAHTYGFIFGPHLNATGRLATAQDALRLLAASSRSKADEIVPLLREANDARKKIQEGIMKEAMEAATCMVANFPTRAVLVLANRGWHPGVVGIVAGRLKEQFRRPVIVCGYNPDSDCFKGSGRSIPGFDLGSLISKAAAAGILLAGGGHAMAAGVKLREDQVATFQDFLNKETEKTAMDLSPSYEVLGEYVDRDFMDWIGLFDVLEPFGNGNPRPSLLIERGQLIGSPQAMTKNADGSIWAYRANFRVRGVVVKLTWKKPEIAKQVWKSDGVYRMVVSASISESKGRVYENCDVDACEAISPTER
jgi:single-stranded-DNA-specific exonuclease